MQGANDQQVALSARTADALALLEGELVVGMPRAGTLRCAVELLHEWRALPTQVVGAPIVLRGRLMPRGWRADRV